MPGRPADEQFLMDDDDMTRPSSPTLATPAAAAAAVSLPNDAIFEILSRMPVKSVGRFLCVSRGWCDLISDPTFLAEHKARHPDPLLVDAGSFQEGSAESRDLRLMDMDGNLVRVIKGVGDFGLICTTSLDDLICLGGGCSHGARVVDPATGEVLLPCPQVYLPEGDLYPRYSFGFGRAMPSGTYKMVRLDDALVCEVLTLGQGVGWRKAAARPAGGGDEDLVPCRRDCPIAINGVMYFLAERTQPDGTLLCFDLRITELNGALCMLQLKVDPARRCTNVWRLLADPDNNGDTGEWIKAYTILMPLCDCVYDYIPLWMMRDDDGGKLLLRCFFDDDDGQGQEVLLIYDGRAGTCTDIFARTTNHGTAALGLCNLHLEHFVTAKNRCR